MLGDILGGENYPSNLPEKAEVAKQNCFWCHLISSLSNGDDFDYSVILLRNPTGLDLIFRLALFQNKRGSETRSTDCAHVRV